MPGYRMSGKAFDDINLSFFMRRNFPYCSFPRWNSDQDQEATWRQAGSTKQLQVEAARSIKGMTRFKETRQSF